MSLMFHDSIEFETYITPVNQGTDSAFPPNSQR